MIHGDLNRRLLWSHCLSRKMRGPDASAKVADACCGIQSQNFQESLSSFWARIDGFKNNDALSDLRPGGKLVRTYAIRSTMHIIPTREFYTYVLGGAGERILNWIDGIALRKKLPPRDVRVSKFYHPVLDEIKGRAVTEEEIRKLVEERVAGWGLRSNTWTGIGDMSFLGLLVHAGRRGSKSLWMRSDDWIHGLKHSPDNQSCRVNLLRKYIASHGPVSKHDIMYWAFLTRRQLDEALIGLKNELIQVKMKAKDPFIDLANAAGRDFPPPPRAIVLPKYDSLLLSLKDKSRVMDRRYYKRIFGALGMVRPTVLLDGFVAAAWRKVVKKKSSAIEVHALKRISADDKKAVEEQFAEYCSYANFEASVKWVRGAWIWAPSR